MASTVALPSQSVDLLFDGVERDIIASRHPFRVHLILAAYAAHNNRRPDELANLADRMRGWACEMRQDHRVRHAMHAAELLDELARRIPSREGALTS